MFQPTSTAPWCWSVRFTEKGEEGEKEEENEEHKKEEENWYTPNSKAWVDSREAQPLIENREESLASSKGTVLNKQLGD